MKERIPINDAKNELKRINDFLDSPKLLIGGIAVNQYVVDRISTDIDIVIDFESANNIISNLYPSLKWNKIDKNNDELRPSYEIISRANSDLIIKFGPKILQREPYEFVDWNILFEGANPFKFKDEELQNILVPSAVNLSFTKLISYVARKKSNPQKAIVDLDDFSNLTNQNTWNTIEFYTMVSRMSAYNFLMTNMEFTPDERGILENSSFYQLLNMFRKPTDEIAKSVQPTDKQVEKVNKAIATGQSVYDKNEGNQIAAIGVDLQGFTAINMKFGPNVGDKIIKTIYELIEKASFRDYAFESIGDTFIIFLTVDDIEEAENSAKRFHEIVSSHNWKEIKSNLYVNTYTTYGLKGDSEKLNEFAKRIFDSLLTQKTTGIVFDKAMNDIKRKEWEIHQMVSYR